MRAAARADRAGRRRGVAGADHGRDGHGQGAGGARASTPTGRARDGPFVAVNCAALPEPLLESELFGHARGAFTGRRPQSRRGLFVEARRRHALPRRDRRAAAGAAGKLLRVLQSGEVRPVGSETARTVDVRCIAATHKDLGAAGRRRACSARICSSAWTSLRVAGAARCASARGHPRAGRALPARGACERSPRSVAGRARARGARLPGQLRLAGQRPPAREPDRAAGRHRVGAARPARGRPAGAGARARAPIRSPRLVQNPLNLEELVERYIAAVLKSVDGSKPKAAEILGVDLSTLYRREKRSS